MRRNFRRIKGVGFFLWQAKHEMFHVLLGLMWAWVLREIWNEFNVRWVITAVVGSLLPDIDHVIFFFTYGKRDPYTRAIITFLKNKEWRVLVKFIAKGHKYQTNLMLHNYFVMIGLFSISAISYSFDWKFSVVLFGAMMTHYLYDLIDDIFMLGYVNPNWRRLGRSKSRSTAKEDIAHLLP